MSEYPLGIWWVFNKCWMNKWMNLLYNVLKDYPESEVMALEVILLTSYFMAAKKLISFLSGLWKAQGSWIRIFALSLW